MREVRGAKMLLAAAVCSLLLFVSFAAVPASAASPSKTVDLVATERIGPVSIAIDDVDAVILEQLLAQLPEEAQEALGEVEYICIDGLAHINVKAWEKKGVWQVNLHFQWHGAIALCDGDLDVILGLHANNLQLMLHLQVESLDLEGIDAFANVHLNGAILVGDGEEVIGLDVKLHIILRIEAGELTMFKVWLPEL